MGKEYINFFLNNKNLILNFKSKKKKNYKHAFYNYDNDLQTLIDLKFKKAKGFSNFLYSFNLILKKYNNIKSKNNLNKKILNNEFNNKILKNSNNVIKTLITLF